MVVDQNTTALSNQDTNSTNSTNMTSITSNSTSNDNSFLDPGVSNGDVDWLFRGREIKKLSKKSNTINNEVQSQLLHAQQKALIQSKNISDTGTATEIATGNGSGTTTSASTSSSLTNLQNNENQQTTSPIPIPKVRPTSNSISNQNLSYLNHSTSSSTSISDLPLKSSLKQSPAISLKLDTNVFISSSPTPTPASKSPSNNRILSSSSTSSQLDSPLLSTSSKSFQSPSSGLVSSSSIQHQNNLHSQPTTPTSTTSTTSTTTTPTTNTNRSRSSSLFGRAKSPSNASDHKPSKKSLLSSLSSKIKGTSTTTSIPSSPTVSRNSSVSKRQNTTPPPVLPPTNTQIPVIPQNSHKITASSIPPHPQKSTTPITKDTPFPNTIPSSNKVVSSINSLAKLAHAQNFDHTHSNLTSDQQIVTSDKSLDSISFKRVCFALDDLIEDPQQQIPSRKPKKGNVLIPEDMIAPPPKLSIGITNSFNEQTKDEKPNVDPELYKQAIQRQKFFLEESKKHSEEAHIAAMRMAKEVSSFKRRKSSVHNESDFDEYYESYTEGENDDNDDDDNNNNDDDDDNDDIYKFDEKLDIDTPLHTHVDYFGSLNDDNTSISSSNKYDENTEISLETLYTRCCHLREILPIPATLKQLKNKSKPLHVIKMLNPKPTLIDILSFADFLAIAPIITVILDNVMLDTEMLKIILISLKNSKMLDKLSLRNVPIDSDGWKFICKFLNTNKNIQKLDISQQKIKKGADHSKILRSDLDWDLFTNTLVSRGGIEELVMNGCSLSTIQLKNLVHNALVLKTKRLGLASSQLDYDKMDILSKWISLSNTTCNGIDFAFNDLSQNQLLPLNNVLKSKNSHDNIKLQFFSLNSTNVQLNECIELIKNLSNVPTLRFLDLSNNSHLFPDIIPVLRDYLPKYPDLRRLHFDFDNLTEISVVQLCMIFQKCHRLVHISFLGNNTITSKSASALYSAVKNSHIYNIDMDYDSLDEELVSRISFYLMRNMETFLNFDDAKHKTSSDSSITAPPTANLNISDINSRVKESIAKEEDLIYEGSLLTKAAEHLLENDTHIEGEERLVIYRALVEKTIKLRNEIHDAMNKLFEIREKGNLIIEGKENLLRFCLLDDSLQNILDIFSEEVSIDDDKKNPNENVNINSNNNHKDTTQTDYTTLRPSMMRRISSQLSRHQTSDDIMQTTPIITDDFYQHNDEHETITTAASEAPHIVVADADSVPVDSTTGQRVLMRKFSQTSVYSKKLEEEEGELHRWGFFVQQQNDIMPDDSQNSNSDLAKKKLEEKEREKERLRIEAEKQAEKERRRLKINTIPSGSELRETIMKVKGIESISDLIKKVNKDFTTVETIYKHADAKRAVANKSNDEKITNSSPIDASSSTNTNNKFGFGGWFTGTANPTTNETKTTATATSDAENNNITSKTATGEGRVSNDVELEDTTLSPTISINSINDGDIKDQADEVYERILNNVIRVRSNK